MNAFLGWPLVRQFSGRDRLDRGEAAQSRRSATLQPRTVEADEVVDSICPFCAVGCAQKVFVKDGKVTIPKGLDGTVYAVLTNDENTATDATTVAGPAILSFPFNSRGEYIHKN